MSVDDSSGARLLAEAAGLLRENGFAVRSERLDRADIAWVLAESDLFIVAVAAARDLADLRRVESFAAPELVGRLGTSDGVGGKRWDAYLVLVSSRALEEPAAARDLVDMEYDTHGVRRLVSVAVEPTKDDLRRVLRPFIPLPPPTPGGLNDAFEDLHEQLVVNGVEAPEAQRVVAAFQDRGHLDDV